jgi:Protein of unknown function (DUF2635)
MHITPAEGLAVRDPLTRRPIPTAGIDIAATDGFAADPYWRERIAHGDVVVTAPRKSAPDVIPLPAPEATAAPELRTAEEIHDVEAHHASDAH